MTEYQVDSRETWQCPPWAITPTARVTVRQCLPCGARVAWLKTEATGLLVRVNQDGTSHASTCPQAEATRKRAASREEAAL